MKGPGGTRVFALTQFIAKEPAVAPIAVVLGMIMSLEIKKSNEYNVLI